MSWPSQVVQSSGAGVQGTSPGPPPIQQGNYGDLGLVATTGPNGFTLVNATPTILSWIAPNDAQLHRFLILAYLNVTTLEVGGNVNMQTSAGATFAAGPLFAAALAVGGHLASLNAVVPPGQTVQLFQGTALTGGAAVLFAEMWAS